MRILVLFNLHADADPAAYERWAHASEDAAYETGEAINVSGGEEMR